MSDFFGALELELRAAAERRPRRQIGLGAVIGAAAGAALLVAAVLVVAAISGGGNGDTAQPMGSPRPDPVGTVIPKGEGSPPRRKRSVVVATGTTRLAGPWQMEISRSERLVDDRGGLMQPAGLKCLTLYLLDQPAARGLAASGYCGPQPRTPGFTRGQMTLPSPTPVPVPGGESPGARQVLIYGRAPERAAYVTLTVEGRLRMRARVFDGPPRAGENYYLVAVPAHVGRTAKINWLDKDGKPGSRGTRLLPPAVTR
jgi:hypothetical protein